MNQQTMYEEGIDWQTLIEVACSRSKPPPRKMAVYHETLGSWSRPMRVTVAPLDSLLPTADDRYVVKARRIGREQELTRVMLCDQLVGRLGALLQAPVPPVDLVYIPERMVTATPELRDVLPGLAHGSREIPNCGDRESVTYVTTENRARFARLAVLYGWCAADDHQFLYQTTADWLVWSVDHGHFLGGPNVPFPPDASHLKVPELDQLIVQQASLTNQDLEPALLALKSVTAGDVAEAVATLPDEWGMTLEKRVTLTVLLWERRMQLLGHG